MQRDDIVTRATTLILKIKAQRSQLNNFTKSIRGQAGKNSDSIHIVITEVQEWIEELYDMIAGLFTKKTVWELEKVREEFMKLEAHVEEGRVANEKIIKKLMGAEAVGDRCLLSNMTLEVSSDMTFPTNCTTITVVF